MLKKVAGITVLAVVLTLPLSAMAGERHHGGGWDGPSHDAPEIDGANLMLGMTLLTGIVGLAKRRRSAKK